MFELQKIETISKSARVEEIIREKIQNGELKPGGQLPSEVFLASELGTHRLTVNKAMSNLVRDGLLYREHGRGTFVKDPSDAKSTTRTVSIIFAGELSNMSNEYFFCSYQALCSYLSEYNIIIKTEMFKSFDDCKPLPGIDAAVIFSFNDIKTKDLKIFSDRKIPVVLFNRYLSGKQKVSSVIADNRAAAEDVTSLLIGDGCRDILYVRNKSESSVARDRLGGCQAAFASANHGGSLSVIDSKGWLGPDAYESISSVIKDEKMKFSAVICEGIHILWGVRSFFEENKFPGYRNLVFACLDSWGTIPVFISNLRYSVEFPLTEMGRAAGKLLVDAVEGEHAEPSVLKIPGWVIGKNNSSCAKEAK